MSGTDFGQWGEQAAHVAQQVRVDEREAAAERVRVKRAARLAAPEVHVNPAAVRVRDGVTGVELDGWYCEGRVPGATGGFSDHAYGPFPTPAEAARYGRERRLGGQRLYELRDGKRVV